ncbi:MAG: hypothetical protein KJO69_11090, partial [Gammaproteobacteria bacterium]|nr:hypothetical protein [Gammaproteobacteria bacterium]
DASGEEELEDLAKGLTDKNAEARIVSAQKRMHDATMELSTARKERDSLAEKLEAIQKERDQLLNDIEQGSAKPMYDRVRDELLEDLSDEAKDFYDMNPEALEIEVRKELRSRKKDAPVAKGNDSSEPEQAEGKLSKAEKDWNKAILNDIPNYYTEIETPRFQKFIESNKSLLSQVNRTYDRLDPEGSRVLFKHYYKWQELASRKAKNKPKISSRPRTRARTNPSSRGRSSESREAIEEEFERSLR